MNTNWQDARLAFSARSDIPDYFKSQGLNATAFSSSLFMPDIKLSNSISSHWLSKRVLISEDGTVNYDREGLLEFSCKFDFTDLPFDKHVCASIMYQDKYPEEVLALQIGNRDRDSNDVVT